MMSLGLPDLSKVAAEFREQTSLLIALLTEVRDLLRQIRDNQLDEMNGPRG